MSSAKEKMRMAMTRSNQTAQPTVPKNVHIPEPENISTEDPAVVDEPIVEEKPVQVKAPTITRKVPQPKHTELPSAVALVARDDVPITDYGVKPVQVHFNTVNRELRKWITNFSSDNQFNGGVAITKSQAIEIMLDVIMYDLGINPIGYESHSELREDIQRKMKEF